MSSPPADDGAPSLTRQQQQQSYKFSGRVLLTAVVILAILTVVFVLVRLILVQFVLRGERGLAAGIRRSFGRIASRRGLDAAALAALPVTAYHRQKEDGEGGSTSGGGSGADCAVCLSELADGEKVRALPACGHVFHVECVDAWLRTRTTCPVCRADVAPPNKDADAVFRAGATTLVVTVVEAGGAAQTRGSSRVAVLGAGQPAGAAG